MANLIEAYMQSQPVSRISGTGGPSHTATWHAEVDEPLVGDHVIYLAQDGPGAGFPAGSTRLPALGDRLLWGNGAPVADVGQTIATHAAQYPNGYADGGAYALDFNCRPMPGAGPSKHYAIDVVWRPPDPGKQEYPWQLPAFKGIGVGSGTIPLETAPGTGGAGVARTAREYWLEYRTEEFPVWDAYRVFSGVPASTKTPMMMPNYEPYEPLIDTRLKAIQVIATNVPDPGVAIGLNNDFQGTINSDVLQLSTFSMAKYRVTFESARTGRPIRNKNTTYYRMEIRLELHYEAPFVNRIAAGSYAINGPVRNAPKDDDGIPLGLIGLKSDGSATDSEATTHRDLFSLKKPVAYSTAFGWT